MRWILTIAISLCVLAAAPIARGAEVEQWGTYEITLPGPSEGNPFADVTLTARFVHGDTAVAAHGFYDGDGTYRIRFMPDSQGAWHYETKSNRPELSGKTGEFTCTKPSSNNHGPVRVKGFFHFAYADGTSFFPIGTTCYNWANENEDLRKQTVETLKASAFNKVRMCVLPTRQPSTTQPSLVPFDSTGPSKPTTRPTHPTRYNPAFFQRFEQTVAALRDMGVEADVILFHPYAQRYWAAMDDNGDDNYLRYAVARLAAYRNVWWSMCNEFDFIRQKNDEDWDRMFQVVQSADPFNHLRSIHNGRHNYDPFKPWVTHMSVQNGGAVADFGRAVTYRQFANKPVVFDEVRYEGNIAKRWGQLSAEEMTERFWFGAIAGTYVTHGEAFEDPNGAWTGKGGVLIGKSPQRIAFFKEIMSTAPAEGLEPLDQYHETHIGARPPGYYLVYLGREKPTEWLFQLPAFGLADGMQFKAEVIDTWNMTVTPVEGRYTVKRLSQYTFRTEGEKSIPLPGKQFMALRLRHVPGTPATTQAVRPASRPRDEQ